MNEREFIEQQIERGIYRQQMSMDYSSKKSRFNLNSVYDKIDAQGGFLTNEDVKIVAKTDRLTQILVRCGNCRFVAAAQDIKHLTDIIERDGHDYVRDFSLPVTHNCD